MSPVEKSNAPSEFFTAFGSVLGEHPSTGRSLLQNFVMKTGSGLTWSLPEASKRSSDRPNFEASQR